MRLSPKKSKLSTNMCLGETGSSSKIMDHNLLDILCASNAVFTARNPSAEHAATFEAFHLDSITKFSF